MSKVEDGAPSQPPSPAAVVPHTAAATAAASRSSRQSHSRRSPCATSPPSPFAAFFPARAPSRSSSPAAAGGLGWVGGGRRQPRTSRRSRSPWRSPATGSRRSRRPGMRPAWARRSASWLWCWGGAGGREAVGSDGLWRSCSGSRSARSSAT
ncbi:hypothetical protein SEVIR_8G161566v4 [Setaria viridis]